MSKTFSTSIEITINGEPVSVFIEAGSSEPLVEALDRIESISDENNTGE